MGFSLWSREVKPFQREGLFGCWLLGCQVSHLCFADEKHSLSQALTLCQSSAGTGACLRRRLVSSKAGVPTFCLRLPQGNVLATQTCFQSFDFQGCCCPDWFTFCMRPCDAHFELWSISHCSVVVRFDLPSSLPLPRNLECRSLDQDWTRLFLAGSIHRSVHPVCQPEIPLSALIAHG